MKGQTIFGNFFNSSEITTTRLHNFGQITVSRMSTDTVTPNLWSYILPALQQAVQVVGDELGLVDTTTNIRMGATDTVDNTLASFKQYMLVSEPFIARAIGGEGTPPYLEFYPAGTHEYTRITKTTAPTLLKRIALAGAKYSITLGEPLAGDLQRFYTIYDGQRGDQQGHKGEVEEHRSQRTASRTALELLLLKAVFIVGSNFPGDVERCSSFFEFERLYHHSNSTGHDAPPAV